MKKRTDYTKHTIFWADDDQDDLELIREFLNRHAPNHEMIEFADGYDLFEQLKALDKEQYPCLIVLDMNMPRLSGKETLYKIKQEPVLRSIPVVVFTTSVRSEDKVFCDSFGVVMIEKPLSANHLRDAVQAIAGICNPQLL